MTKTLFYEYQRYVDEMNKLSTGQIVNHMSIDTDSIVNAVPNIHSLWSMPFQLIVTFYLLYYQIGISFVSLFFFFLNLFNYLNNFKNLVGWNWFIPFFDINQPNYKLLCSQSSTNINE